MTYQPMRSAPHRTLATIAALAFLVPSAIRPAAAQQPRRDNPKIPSAAIVAGDSVPHLVGYDLSNEVVEFPWADHRVHLIQFWATFAQPSLDQMPTLQSLYEQHAGDGLSVVGVAWERLSLPNLKAVRDDVGLEYPMIRPHPKFDQAWRSVGAFPTTFLVDADGKVLRRYLGWSEAHKAALAADVAAALAGKPLGPVIEPQRNQYVTRSEAAQRRS